MQDAGFLPGQKPGTLKHSLRPGAQSAEAPPVPGAKLGKDPEGNPAWFAPDPDRPGKYIRVGS
ncbi:MAG: hypothetical protein KC416_15685, partial [Myxococcales bacterium]|nr:hypothetical protein [Myxococcales bacterium]